jgi:hypothetical protein
MIVNAGYRGKVGAGAPKFTYTGQYNIRKDGVVELLTSGTIVFLEPKVIDVFMVGGGGGGASAWAHTDTHRNGYSGGGGGYTRTIKRVSAQNNQNIVVTIGAGGSAESDGNSTAFNNYAVNGGKGAKTSTSYTLPYGGAGGSGGGGGVNSNSDYGTGGNNGANGETGYPDTIKGGAGQGFTTREFGEPTAKLYAGGGGGGRYMVSSAPIVSMGGTGGGGSGAWCGSAVQGSQAAGAGGANTGGGGGGGALYSEQLYQDGASGGSGIVCFRDAAPLPELAGTWVLNERLYAPEKDFDEITGYRFKVGTIECTRIRTSNLTHLSAFKVFSGDTVDIYTFSTNTWRTTARNLTFPAGATASDEFRRWLASNATKQ